MDDRELALHARRVDAEDRGTPVWREAHLTNRVGHRCNELRFSTAVRRSPPERSSATHATDQVRNVSAVGRPLRYICCPFEGESACRARCEIENPNVLRDPLRDDHGEPAAVGRE